MTVGEASAFFASLDLGALRSPGGRQARPGDPRPPALPHGGRPRLHRPRPHDLHPERRRGPAHQPGRGAQRLARRHALRARRAVDRPPPARQPPPHPRSCARCATSATRSSSSSTTPTSSGPPSTSSTWARGPARPAARSSSRAPGRPSSAAAIR
ncbi:MAG: hypothetical protein MZW92_62335 [Comamonadaceae bacterium]|nr:hypothetical protein [Comamonadaceae bacterium]